MAEKDEPAYMLAARSNVRGGAMTTPLVVEALLDRIDRQDKALTETNNELRDVKSRFH